jgi:hypothetical protein
MNQFSRRAASATAFPRDYQQTLSTVAEHVLPRADAACVVGQAELDLYWWVGPWRASEHPNSG